MQLAAPAKALLGPRAGCAVPSHCQLPSRGTSVLQNGSDAIDWGAQCATIFGQNDEQTRRSAELPQPLAKKRDNGYFALPATSRRTRCRPPRSVARRQWQAAPARRPARRDASSSRCRCATMAPRARARAASTVTHPSSSEMPHRTSMRVVPAWRRNCDTTAASSTQGAPSWRSTASRAQRSGRGQRGQSGPRHRSEPPTVMRRCAWRS